MMKNALNYRGDWCPSEFSQQHTAYDDAGRLSELTLGNGAVYRFTYDTMDRLASETGPGGQPLVTRYDYDNAGRLITRHLPATEHAPASSEHYHWGTHGQLDSVTNDHGEVTFRYDHAQRMIGEQQRHASIEGTTNEHTAWSWQHQHTLTATGAPQASQFGELPALNWHTYGSGHLHGLSMSSAAQSVLPAPALHSTPLISILRLALA